jgi:hypothetical protein
MANILGDINPPNRPQPDHDRNDNDIDPNADESIVGGSGSQHDRTKHSGSRDVTEGVTGGTGTETGGSRNFRTGTGATGTDIGNRPE